MFYINSGNCLKANTQCKTFNVNTGSCETCYEGFAVVGRECLAGGSNINNNSLPGGSNMSTTVVDDHCQLKSGMLCLKCHDGYFLSYNSTYPVCSKVNPLCATYNEYNGNCYTCLNNYIISNGSCLPAAVNPNYMDIPQINCKEYDLGLKVCHACYPGYYYSSMESSCKVIVTSCKTASATGHCTGCYEGCVLNSTVCIPIANSLKQLEDKLTYDSASSLENDPYCTAVSENKCIQCTGGYFVDLTTNKCAVQSQWCDTYVMIGGLCTKCKLGSVMQAAICIKPALGLD